MLVQGQGRVELGSSILQQAPQTPLHTVYPSYVLAFGDARIRAADLMCLYCIPFTLSIQSCNFTKMHNNTWLKVSFSGNLRVGGCTNCCARWFFAFDGVECSTPVPIDASIYVVGPHTANPLRPRHIEGYCGSIPKGPLSVDFSVGTCSGFSVANAYTGWNSASRVIIEEVEPPQQ